MKNREISTMTNNINNKMPQCLLWRKNVTKFLAGSAVADVYTQDAFCLKGKHISFLLKEKSLNMLRYFTECTVWNESVLHTVISSDVGGPE